MPGPIPATMNAKRREKFTCPTKAPKSAETVEAATTAPTTTRRRLAPRSRSRPELIALAIITLGKQSGLPVAMICGNLPEPCQSKSRGSERTALDNLQAARTAQEDGIGGR
jgi:hypothetical protein